MDRIAIVEGVRTPFCKMGTYFNELRAQELGRIVAREILERTEIDLKEIDEVIFGCVGQPADAANIARVIALLAGVSKKTPAYTVHRNCASGIEAAQQACIKILAGEGSCYLVGGTESMSNIPIFLTKKAQDTMMLMSRAKGPGQFIPMLWKFYSQIFNPKKGLNIGLQLGFSDPVCGLNMGQTAEVLAKEFGITRKEQDEFSLQSHLRAIASKDILREEIVPVIPSPRYKKAIEDDNGPRDGQTMEALTKLRPFFDRRSGTVTAGNASQITDGAAALLIMKESKAKKLGYEPMGYIRAFGNAGVDPHRMGIGPAHTIPEVLKKAGMKLKDVQAVEINEAFAVQVLACLRALDSKEFAKDNGYVGFTGPISYDILNVNGGAVALGHPVGTTGARLILTMLKHLKRNNLNVGMVSLCIGGGQGAAVILER